MSAAAAAVVVANRRARNGGGSLWSDGAAETGVMKGKQALALKARSNGKRLEQAANQREIKWVLRARLIRCHNLPRMDMIGSADPYITFDIPGHDQQRSKTLKNTLNPEFNEDFVFEIHDDRRQLELTVWDWNRWSGDEKIGRVRFWLADLCGKESTDSYSLCMANTKQKEEGKEGKDATITLALSASNHVASSSGASAGDVDERAGVKYESRVKSVRKS